MVVQFSFNHVPVFQISRPNEAIMVVIADDNREKENKKNVDSFFGTFARKTGRSCVGNATRCTPPRTRKEKKNDVRVE